jgi:hypothetical protein
MTAKYTTQLQAGLGLVAETSRLLDLWEPGMSGQDLLKRALASGSFPTKSARRLRNLIIEAFAPRFLVDDAAPARLLKRMAGILAKDDFRSLCFLFSCRANPILGDFVREVYWTRYAAGGNSVSKEDALRFVEAAVRDGKTTSRWSESTIVRIARYLLGSCADFGLLGAMKAEARGICSYRITPTIASILAHDLHFKGLGDNAMVRSEDWGLFGIEANDVLGELKRLALQGEIILQSAGAVTHIAWKYKSMEDVAHGLAQG